MFEEKYVSFRVKYGKSEEVMDRKNWEINDDGTYLNSVSKIHIPWLEKALDVWIDLDQEEKRMTHRQQSVLEEFISINSLFKSQLSVELENIYSEELKNNRIKKN